MMRGWRRLLTYDAVDTLNPGHTSSVTHAPPRMSRRSRITTLSPALAR